MKQAQLKDLAIWYYDDVDLIVHEGFQPNSMIVENVEKRKCYTEYWKPHVDSTQLDMLEDKMVAELRKNNQWQIHLQIECFVTGWFCCRVLNVPDKRVLVCGDNGKTKNEARLSTVVNYLKGKL